MGIADQYNLKAKPSSLSPVELANSITACHTAKEILESSVVSQFRALSFCVSLCVAISVVGTSLGIKLRHWDAIPSDTSKTSKPVHLLNFRDLAYLEINDISFSDIIIDSNFNRLISSPSLVMEYTSSLLSGIGDRNVAGSEGIKVVRLTINDSRLFGKLSNVQSGFVRRGKKITIPR